VDSDDLRGLVDAYRAELVAMDSLSLVGRDRARQWNRHVERMQRAHLELRRTLTGRASITEMIADDVPTVALWSASHALFWAEPQARAYLLARGASGGRGSLEASMTLQEFDADRLKMDWEPKAR
jgi:hypothetical protein